MSNGPLLSVEPQDLEFAFELDKQISCKMNLWNRSDEFVAFKVKTTNPKKYCVRPNIGVVQPNSIFEVIVTMQAQQEAPPDLQCKDKFLLQSAAVAASQEVTAKDITPDMFRKDSGRRIEETKLKVVYVPPAQQPSPIREEAERDVSPADSVADNGSYNLTDPKSVSRAPAKPQIDLSERRAQLISKLSKDKLSIFQENDNLRREMDLLRQGGSSSSHVGFSFVFVVIVGLLGMLMGCILKKN